MRNWLEKLTPNSWLGKKLLMAAVLIGACAVAFCWGRRQHVVAQGVPGDPFVLPKGRPGTPDYDRRIVAYLYRDVPVTREEFGEYLIARFGADRLEFMVNRRIVEIECKKHNIHATDTEVEQRFRQDLNSFGKMPLTEQDFVNNVLRRFNKTLYEWKEDVIRPKIMMEKLVKSQVKIEEKDVRKGFEARYGPKVECRMIVLQKDSSVVHTVWNDVRKGREQFLVEAKKQFIPNLATEHGKVPPIHKHFGDKLLEETAFRLRENEVSEPLKMPDGTHVILLCDRHLPADVSVRYEQVWLQISKEVEDLQIAQKMPEVFAKLRAQANPQLMLENAVFHTARVESSGGAPLTWGPQKPGLQPLPSMNVPPPVPTKLTPPPGIIPLSVPNTPPPAPNVFPGVTLPTITPPVEKK